MSLNGKIYKIYNTVNQKIYIGSTTREISERMNQHRTRFNLKYMPLYRAMREIGRDNFFIELIEELKCDERKQLYEREGYWIKHYESTINGYNKVLVGRNQKQYYEDTKHHPEKKERKKSYYKKWISKNKDYYRAFRRNTYKIIRGFKQLPFS